MPRNAQGEHIGDQSLDETAAINRERCADVRVKVNVQDHTAAAGRIVDVRRKPRFCWIQNRQNLDGFLVHCGWAYGSGERTD